MKTETIGFVGLGRMGRPMASNLCRKGFDLVVHDVNPQAPVHVLLIPKKVIRTHADLSAEDAAVMGHIHLVAVKLAKQLGLGAGYRLVINCDEQAGQTVPHLHFHLLGGRAMGCPPG